VYYPGLEIEAGVADCHLQTGYSGALYDICSAVEADRKSFAGWYVGFADVASVVVAPVAVGSAYAVAVSADVVLGVAVERSACTVEA
jgi:hypothetical protein